MTDRYDPAAYKPGDTIYIGKIGGWRPLVTAETVGKVTPSGQIVTDRGVRISNRGVVVGDTGRNGRRVLSVERAAEIQREVNIAAIWNAVHTACEHIMRAARNKDRDALAVRIMELMTINDKLKDEA